MAGMNGSPSPAAALDSVMADVFNLRAFLAGAHAILAEDDDDLDTDQRIHAANLVREGIARLARVYGSVDKARAGLPGATAGQPAPAVADTGPELGAARAVARAAAARLEEGYTDDPQARYRALSDAQLLLDDALAKLDRIAADAAA